MKTIEITLTTTSGYTAEVEIDADRAKIDVSNPEEWVTSGFVKHNQVVDAPGESIPEEVWAELDAACEAARISEQQAELAEEALAEFLADEDDEEA